MATCPNKNLKEWKDLVTEVGELKAYYLWDKKYSKPNIKPGVSELFESNPELADAVYEALRFKTTIIQDNKSYYRGQVEKPTIDKDGNLVIYAREDELYKRAGLKSKGVSMTDDLQSAIEYGNGQLEVAQNVLEEEYGYDVLGYEFENKIAEIQDNGYYLVQIPKNISNEIVKEAGEVKVIGDKIVIPKGQYKIKQVIDGVDTEITPQQKQQAQQQYSQYLDTIFPDSKVKDIVYKGGSENIDYVKDFDKIEKETSGSYYPDFNRKGLFFSNKKELAEKYGKLKSFIIDLSKASEYTTGDENSKIDVIESGKYGDKSRIIYWKNPKDKALQKFTDLAEYIVFEPEQIHILSSKADIQGFKEFVDKDSQSFNQLSTDNTKPIEQLDSKIKEWLTTMGIDYRAVDAIANSLGLDPVAKADTLRSVLEIVEGRRDRTTLSEEAAHFLVAMLPKDSVLYKAMMDKVAATETYKKVVAEYSEAYNNDEVKLREEAVGKLIAQEVIKLYEESVDKKVSESTATISFITRFFDNLLRWLRLRSKNILSSAMISNEMTSYKEAALLLLDKEKSKQLLVEGGLKKIDTSFNRSDESYYYYQTSTEALSLKETISKNLHTLKIKSTVDGYITLDGGIKIKNRVTDYVKRFYETIFKDKDKLDSESKNRAVVGTVLHEIKKLIINKELSGETYSKDSILKEVKEDLLNDLKFRIDYDQIKLNPFKLGLNESGEMKSFKELVDSSKKILEQIKLNTERINKLSGTTGNAEVFTELGIYDEENDVAGTIDLLVLYPNGVVGIYDYKSMNFFNKKEISSVKIEAFTIQLDWYKKILTQKYGVKDFAESRIIPIEVAIHETNNQVMSIKSGGKDLGNKDREYLDQIPIKEFTVDEQFNKNVLLNLYAYQEKLRVLVRKDYKNERLKARLLTVDKAIKQILLYKDIDYVADEIEAINKELDLKEKIDSTSETSKPLNDETLREMNEFVNIFEKVAVEFYNYKKSELSTEAVNKISRVNLEIGLLKTRLISKTKELVNKINPETDIDIPHKQLGFFTRVFSPLFNIKNPAFKKITSLVRDLSWNVNKDIEDIITDMTPKVEALEQWAKSNGMSLSEAYDIIINDTTGNMNPVLSKTYFEERDKVFKSGDNIAIKSWVNKNHIFDKEAYNKAFAEKKARVEAEFSGDKYDDFRNTILKKYEEKYDASKYSSAYTENNWFLKIDHNKIDSSYLTDFYKHINLKGNEPLKVFYDSLVGYNVLFSKITGKDISRNFLAEIRQSIIEKVSNNGVGSLLHMKKNFLDSMEVREEDVLSGSIDTLTGKSVKNIPLFYTNKLTNSISPKQLQDLEAEVSALHPKGSEKYMEVLRAKVKYVERQNGIKTKNKDLYKGLILFAKTAYTYKYLKESEAYVNNLAYYLENGGGEEILTDGRDKALVNKFSDKALTKLGIPSSDLELLNNFIDSIWYGKSLTDKDKIVGKKTLTDSEGNVISENIGYSSTKLLRDFLGYIAVKSLGLNPFVAAGNFVGSRANLYMLAAEARFFNLTQLNTAHKNSVYDREKYIAASEMFKPYANDIIREMANNVSAKSLEKILTLDNTMIMMKKPDEMIDNLVLNSMMQNYGLSESGRIVALNRLPENSKSLYELLVKNDKDVWELKDITSEEMAKFRVLVQKQSTKIKGSVPSEYKAQYSKTTAGVILMQFRGWMPGLISTRFSSTEFDEESESLDSGRFRVFFGELVNSGGFVNGLKEFGKLLAEATITGYFNGGLKKINIRATQIAYDRFISENPSYANKLTIEDFIEMRTAKIRGMAMEIRLYLMLAILLSLGKAALPDDKDDEIQQFFARNAYMAANRGYLELSLWFEPSSVKQILKRPIPSMGFIDDVESFVINTFSETGEIITGNSKKNDKKPIGSQSLKLLPFTKPFVDMFDVYSTFKAN